MDAGPKAFISYSWSSDEHQQWVISLATQMRENGVDVILDKWDLKEGNDAIAFMEQMVSDSTVKKVIVILDRVYAQKADGRQGGVGTETQIITPQIYKSVDQQKFVGKTPMESHSFQYFIHRAYTSTSATKAFSRKISTNFCDGFLISPFFQSQHWDERRNSLANRLFYSRPARAPRAPSAYCKLHPQEEALLCKTI
jgi:hypothetical protein